MCARLLAVLTSLALALGGAAAPLPMAARAPVRRAGRIRSRIASLSGTWRGEYSYFDGENRSTPFVSTLHQKADALKGVIEEPNTFGHPGVPALRALIAGKRVGAFIAFRKTYDGTGGQAHSVEYTGEINDAATRIDGLWRIGRRTGPFFMERDVQRPAGGLEAAAGSEA